MQDISAFAINNWELFTAWFLTIIMLTFNLYGDKIRGFESITPEAAIRVLNSEGAILIDVRNKDELIKDGKVQESSHIPLGALKSKLDSLEQHRNPPVVVICRSGQRSATACAQMKKSGFEQVYNLKGGIISWKGAGLPTTQK